MKHKTIFFSPNSLKQEIPLESSDDIFVQKSRWVSKQILQRKDPRIALILGPCSIHNPLSAIEYAKELKALSQEIQEHFYIVMRAYVEKPRTLFGWKGLLYDPHLQGEEDLSEGVFLTRKLFKNLTHVGIPLATEILNPFFVPYLEDFLTWGFIGARTTSSQIHREVVSSLSFPVGFKNSIDGNILSPIQSVVSVREAHAFLSIDDSGMISSFHSNGNPYCHVVLRGSETHTNFDLFSIRNSTQMLEEYALPPYLMVDCAHGNSQKRHDKEPIVFVDLIESILEGNPHIMGIMLESFWEEGKSEISFGKEHSPYLSVTDPCISLEETKYLLKWASYALSKKATLQVTLS